jgi:hypothetical protein
VSFGRANPGIETGVEVSHLEKPDFVIAGLDPAIHTASPSKRWLNMNHRVKPGGDEKKSLEYRDQIASLATPRPSRPITLNETPRDKRPAVDRHEKDRLTGNDPTAGTRPSLFVPRGRSR